MAPSVEVLRIAKDDMVTEKLKGDRWSITKRKQAFVWRGINS